MTFDYSPYHGRVDFVFIDGNHSIRYVASDTEQALKMLAPGGVILWHDYEQIHPKLVRYIDSLTERFHIYYIEWTRYALLLPKELA